MGYLEARKRPAIDPLPRYDQCRRPRLATGALTTKNLFFRQHVLFVYLKLCLLRGREPKARGDIGGVAKQVWP